MGCSIVKQIAPGKIDVRFAWSYLFYDCFVFETSYTRATPSEITKFQESLAKYDEQFVKLGYLSESNRLVPLSALINRQPEWMLTDLEVKIEFMLT